ncbi:hypothetical protein JGUZn3_02770 [Entomobacter blattae]|uniref:Uncharacterized protein n=1 Tax=Entomobacter blattae TaxID=2762277 RepID=A0A7H1NP25_9PROT|nr:hypothetical protein JGUZn3_02770 [Entomobacter blattae]
MDIAQAIQNRHRELFTQDALNQQAFPTANFPTTNIDGVLLKTHILLKTHRKMFLAMACLYFFWIITNRHSLAIWASTVLPEIFCNSLAA